MNILKRIIKAIFIWAIAMLAMYFIFSPIFPTGSKMPIFISFFVFIFPIFCAIRFSKIRGNDGSKKKNQHFATYEPYQKSKTEQPVTPALGPQKYEIVIFRKSKLQSCAKTYKVLLDGIESGNLRNGGSLSIKTVSGQHRLDFKGYWNIETSFDFNIPDFQQRTNIFTAVSSINGKIFVENISPVKVKPQQSSSKPKSAYSSSYPSVSLSHIDRMDGHDFEQFTADLLRKLGYERVQVTPGSGDQGVDVIAVKDGKKYAIQCKRYGQKLGNKPVQEVYAGKTIYGCNVAVVLTNNYFTDGAKEAARAVGVELWDRDTLRRMLVYAEHMSNQAASTATG